MEYKGYLLTPGPDVTVYKDGKAIFTQKIPVYTDQIIVDKKDRMWVAPRSGDLLCYTAHPDQPSNFFTFYHNYKSVVPDLNSRSITVDTNNRIWIGTRYEGVYCFEIEDTSIKSMQHFRVKDGLTDNFVYAIACDKNNNIWVATQSGLDKISKENGQFIIEGVTRNNNVFQFIQAIAIPKTNQVWTLGNSGSILRIANTPTSIEYKPQLQISLIKANDSILYMPKNDLRFSYFQNNITFEVAAPSFIDEHQVKFSYLLEGSDNKQWSTPSPQATLNFINLPHGKYTLKLKAFFPISSYPPQEMSYTFTITPPWWDTWWSKILIAASVVALIILAIRFYYRRKLQKQKILFEKQQAVEQERTRIAMEMHDDLGSGLTTIRYLAGGLSLQSGNSSKDKAEKIASSAKSLVDNMNDIIWSMKSDNNTLLEALAYIRKQAAEQLETAGIDYHIEFPKELPEIKLTNELKRNLLLISKEAIHNIVKHSAATNVQLTAQLENGTIQLRIADNGKGMDLTAVSPFGNGLKSMRKRAEEIRALLEVMNSKGTTIVITAPV
jgi:signal transduction histidine kinase